MSAHKGPGQARVPGAPEPQPQDRIPGAPPRGRGGRAETCTVDHFPGDLCPQEPTGKVPYPAVTPGAVRGVLVHWALPLLARARSIADDIAERGCEAADPSVCALLGEDIAALIGHGVTDQPPADELAEITRDEPPIRRRVPGAGRLGTREHFLAATGCDGSLRHYFGPPDRAVAQMFDSAGHPPNCPAYTPAADAKAVHASASQVRTPLPAGGVHPCRIDPGAAHLQGPCSCKPGEPAALDPDRAPRIRLGDRTTSVVFGRVLTEPLLLVPAACWPDEPEWVEPAAPVEEDPAARARRLDRERDDAGRAYRAAIHEADNAWRAIGGR